MCVREREIERERGGSVEFYSYVKCINVIYVGSC